MAPQGQVEGPPPHPPNTTSSGTWTTNNQATSTATGNKQTTASSRAGTTCGCQTLVSSRWSTPLTTPATIPSLPMKARPSMAAVLVAADLVDKEATPSRQYNTRELFTVLIP
ncbi:uncharacterized protein LOC121854193 isoform X5 [Homarus americanus]|uniref:uncharacterized protein LOC121854193 isoform X5 n=1 Tax=Homarus americanus TaxID=6706 RepID=UPI001C45A027|nr:uncharacterized protein LOC121854193 isoform X5 [Homarus americanus]